MESPAPVTAPVPRFTSEPRSSTARSLKGASALTLAALSSAPEPTATSVLLIVAGSPTTVTARISMRPAPATRASSTSAGVVPRGTLITDRSVTTSPTATSAPGVSASPVAVIARAAPSCISELMIALALAL